MDALVISKNGTPQIAAELREAATVSVSVAWIGNDNNNIYVDVTGHDGHRLDRWHPLSVMVGDRISFVTSEVTKIDRPIESLTDKEMVERVRNQPKMIPVKGVLPASRDIGDLNCYINGKHCFSFRLTNENMVSIDFVWLGDKTGESLIHIASDALSGLETPKIGFGDEITFHACVQNTTA